MIIPRTTVCLIYIAHPYCAEPAKNALRVQALAREVALGGDLPLAPQLYLPTFLSEAAEWELALRFCSKLLSLADEVWVYGDPTDGIRMEIAEAHRLGIPVVQKDLLGDREPDENRSRQRPETVNNQQRVFGSEKGMRALGGRGIKSLQPGR